jgi:hypothetical protein
VRDSGRIALHGGLIRQSGRLCQVFCAVIAQSLHRGFGAGVEKTRRYRFLAEDRLGDRVGLVFQRVVAGTDSEFGLD